MVVTEDCLFLTVQVPSEYKYDPNNLLPVMIWIHGGGFVAGSHNDKLYIADNLSNSTGAIVVSMNYRLGWLIVFHQISRLYLYILAC